MIKNILVPIDNSAPSAAALNTAVELAENLHATITLITVLAPLSTWVAGPFGAIAQMIEEDTKAEHHARARLLKAAAKRIPDQVAFRTVLSDGEPADRIIAQLDEGDYDLVVLGARGLGALKSALLGGVSRRVLGATDVPTLIVRASEDEQPLVVAEPAAETLDAPREDDAHATVR